MAETSLRRRPGALLCPTVLVLCLLTACSLGRPNPRDAVSEVVGVGGGDQALHGDLFLMDDGLWAFVGESDADLPELEQGQAIGYRSRDGQARHLFAVVVANEWGALLQRLDLGPTRLSTTRGSLETLSVDDEAARRWGFCMGDGHTGAMAECLEAFGAAHFVAYPRSEVEGRLAVASEELPAAAMPLRHVRLDRRGERRGLALTQEEAVAEHGWIAVPARAMAGFGGRRRVAIDPACQLGKPPEGIDVVSTAVSPTDDPARVEAQAFAHGVDALAWCADDQLHVAGAALLRPELTMARGRIASMPVILERPIAVPVDSPARWCAVAAQAAAATADWAGADEAVECLVRRHADADAVGQTALRAMELAAAVGRPEAALRRGAAATAGGWNRQQDPYYMLGRAWADAGLGRTSAGLAGRGRLESLLDRKAHARLAAWLALSELRAMAARRVRPTDATAGRPWPGAFELLAEPDPVERAKRLATLADVDAFGLACPSDGACPLDVYGRRFEARLARVDAASADALIDELAALPTVDLATGFTPSALAGVSVSPRQRALLAAAVLPVAAPGQRSAALEPLMAAVEALVRDDALCVPEADDELRRRVLTRLRLQLERDDQESATATAAWVLGQASASLCDGLDAFDRAALARAAARPRSAPVAARLYDAMLSAADEPTQRLRVLQAAASFAASYEKGPSCKRWQLGLALGYLQKHRLDEADRAITRSINCVQDRQDDLDRTQDVLRAFLDYERSRRIGDDYGPSVRRTLETILHRRSDAPSGCLGLVSLDYRVADHVAPKVASLADGLPIAVAEKGSLSLRTSSDAVAEANAALLAARRALGQARPDLAARSLLEARRGYTQADHRAGLARVAFLEEVVFESKLDGFASLEAAPEPASVRDGWQLSDASRADVAALLRSGQARHILDQAVSDAEHLDADGARAAVAASLLIEDEEQTRVLWRSVDRAARFGTLCPRGGQ